MSMVREYILAGMTPFAPTFTQPWFVPEQSVKKKKRRNLKAMARTERELQAALLMDGEEYNGEVGVSQIQSVPIHP